MHELDLDKHHQDKELVRDQEETDVLAKYLDGDVKVDADVFAVIKYSFIPILLRQVLFLQPIDVLGHLHPRNVKVFELCEGRHRRLLLRAELLVQVFMRAGGAKLAEIDALETFQSWVAREDALFF